ncbi:MAG: hypothetical protein AB7N91_27845 [Candidatus Tectimicrobiota bacterium]
MDIELDSLIRQGKELESQIEQLTAQLARLRQEVGVRMGDRTEYYGPGVVAKKWARVRWDINKELLLNVLPAEKLDYFKEIILTKTKLDQAIKAGYVPPRLYERAVHKEQVGWNVSFKVLEEPALADERQTI